MVDFIYGMLDRRRQLAGFRVFLLVCLAMFAKVAWDIREAERETDARLAASRARLVGDIGSRLGGVKAFIDSFALVASDMITDGQPERAAVWIDSALKERRSLFGAGLAVDPGWIDECRKKGSWSADTNRWSLYLVKNDGGPRRRIPLPYDYADSGLEVAKWYARAVERPDWYGPYFGLISRTNLLAYSVPMRSRTGRFLGVARAVYSLTDLRSQVASSDAPPEGFNALLSANGTIVYHPQVEWMVNRAGLRDLADSDVVLSSLSDSIAKRSARGEMSYDGIFTGKPSTLRYQRIPVLGWYLVTAEYGRGLGLLCLYHKDAMWCLLGFFLAACWGWALFWGRNRLWTGAIGVSAIFSLAIVAICWISIVQHESGTVCKPASASENTLSLANKATCTRTSLPDAYAASGFMNRCFDGGDSIPLIPTGIQIQTMNFTGPNSFSVSGYVWQKHRSRGDTDQLGVEFPEGEDVSMDVAYDDSIGSDEWVRGWRFLANIRQPFGYRLYPLDKEEMWIRMQPSGLNQSVMLEPDFMSYKNGNDALLGIDKNLVVSQWKILGGNFSYARNMSHTNYGRGSFRGELRNHELYFSVHVRRNIFDAFISQFIPLMVIILVLFSILWVGRKKDEPGLLGFNALSGASGCSAVFFIVIYNHISIRSMLGAKGVVYMECYFFVTYLAILFVSLNSIQVAMDHDSKFINYGDNLASRLLYWPMVTGLLFLCTFVAFY